MYIRPISTTGIGANLENRIGPLPAERQTSFSDILRNVSASLEKLDQETLKSQLDLVTGNARDMHTAVLSVEKASLALDLVISVRNKAIEAYQEIMRMPL